VHRSGKSWINGKKDRIDKPHLVRAWAYADSGRVRLDRPKQHLNCPGPAVPLPPERKALPADAGARRVFLHLSL
jgi:hypothetical protein